ncbi:MAG: hypothetical protein ABIA83_00810, partial [Patescibacteria group bacterium]|nr:hypothetical protein [Patescibacteria group bacterium]
KKPPFGGFFLRFMTGVLQIEGTKCPFLGKEGVVTSEQPKRISIRFYSEDRQNVEVNNPKSIEIIMGKGPTQGKEIILNTKSGEMRIYIMSVRRDGDTLIINCSVC